MNTCKAFHQFPISYSHHQFHPNTSATDPILHQIPNINPTKMPMTSTINNTAAPMRNLGLKIRYSIRWRRRWPAHMVVARDSTAK